MSLIRPLALAALAAVAGCTALPGSSLTGTPSGYVETAQIVRAAPTVVLEAGMGAAKETWSDIFAAISSTNTVFAYDRPGIGRSKPTTRPRDGNTIVSDLRALLKRRGLPPPYVLVGHSAGGLYMQLYARLYPSEVAGLVLVDSTHPTQLEGAGSMENRGLASTVIAVSGWFGPVATEFGAIVETGRQVLAAPPLPADLPVVILIATDRSGTDIARFDNAKRADFAQLYPHARVREVEGGHNVPIERPQAVIQAIRDVLAAARRQ